MDQQKVLLEFYCCRSINIAIYKDCKLDLFLNKPYQKKNAEPRQQIRLFQLFA